MRRERTDSTAAFRSARLARRTHELRPILVRHHVARLALRKPREPPLGIDDALHCSMTETLMDLRRILVPTDFGEAAAKALDFAVDLAKKYGAKITLLHVYEVPVYPYPGTLADIDFVTPIREAAQKELASAFDALKLRGAEARSELQYGVPWSAILDTAAHQKADLIVMGTHGRKGVMHALLGSVAEKVVRLSPVPVLTVRSSETEQPTAARPVGASR
jgi:nucleotide-binding universal stress UspA family protein